MKNVLLLFVCVLLSGQALSKTTVNKKKKDVEKKSLPSTPARQEMRTISGLVRGLGPFIASEQEFTKEGNQKFIIKTLQELKERFKNFKNHPSSGAGPALTQNLMLEQLDQTIELLKNNKLVLSRAKLNAALNLCVSCHTQSPGTVNKEPEKLFADQDVEKLKINDFEKAELYFITRDFERAMKLYDKIIKKSKKTDDDEIIYRALERELIYFIKIKKSYALAKVQFEGLLKEQILNPKITQEVTEWVKTLSGKSLWESFDPFTAKDEDLAKFLKTLNVEDEEGPIFTLSNSSEVLDLNLSSILMDYFNAHPNTVHGAKILYWLALLDKRLNDDLFFSLGDYYLLACMENYSKDPIARECYDSYEDDLEIQYLDKNKDYPPEIKERLKKLQKLLNITDESIEEKK